MVDSTIRENIASLIGKDEESFIFSKTGDIMPHYLYMTRLHMAGVIPLAGVIDAMAGGGLFELSHLDPSDPWRGHRPVAAKSVLDAETSTSVDAESESLIKCRKCGFNANFSQAQTRAGDEAMTVFIECLNPSCKIQYRL
jgi:hypothetical protein